MIDTDKYEGHSEDQWILVDDKYIIMKNKTGNVAKFDTRYKTGVKVSQPDMDLIQDAPLLLEEVKRLLEFKDSLKTELDVRGYDVFTHWERIIWGEEE